MNSDALQGPVIQSNLGHHKSCQLHYCHGENSNAPQCQAHTNYSSQFQGFVESLLNLETYDVTSGEAIGKIFQYCMWFTI